MTCIVATDEGVWADRRVTGGYGSVFTPARKVVRGDGLVAAFCGGNSRCSRAIRAVLAGETDLQVLAGISDGAVVNARGRWELSDGAAVRVRKSQPFLVQGAGYAEAQAFLFGRGAWDRKTIREALRYVAKVRFDCGDGVDEILLDRHR